MFRIESFPHSDENKLEKNNVSSASLNGLIRATASVESSIKAIDVTMHVCLATALKEASLSCSEEKGVICTIGRKNASIVFEQDKCVSRKHCTIRMIVSPQSSLLGNDDTAMSTTKKEWFAPQSKHEAKACSDGAVTFVVTDVGSKYGTFIMKQQQQQQQQQQMMSKKHDTNTTDTDTDDEAEAEAPMSLKFHTNAPTTSAATTIEQLTLVEHAKLTCNQSYPLELTNYNNTAWIRCGVSGSLVRITLLPPMIFCMSSTTTTNNYTSAASLATIGAKRITSWSNELCTHLILEKDDKVTSKRLCAWLCDKPLCLPTFIQAFFQTTSTTSTTTLPNPKDYCPTSLNMNGNTNSAMLLLQKPPTKQNITLLSNYVFLFLLTPQQESQPIQKLSPMYEFIPLCEAAGAKVIKLYVSEKEATANHNEDEEKELLIKNIQTEYSEKQVVVMAPPAILQNSNSNTKHAVVQQQQRQWEHVLKHKCHLSFIDTRTLADCILNNKKPTADEVSHPSFTKQQHQQHQQQIEANTNRIVQKRKHLEDKIIEQTHIDESNTTTANINTNNHEEVLEQQQPSENRSVKRLKTATETPPEWQGRTNNRSQKQQQQQQQQQNGLAIADEDNFLSGGKTSSAVASSTDTDIRTIAATDKSLKKRKHLPSASKDGWLNIAPSDEKNRAAYRSLDFEQLRNEAGVEEALTEFRSDLVVVRKTNKLIPQSGRNNHDFKKFRKNFVLKGLYDAKDVTLMAVLPKETDRQRQLELTQRQIEEEELLVDALFNNNPARTHAFQSHPKKKRGVHG